ncbi:MAG: hypothetical protein WCL06_01170 [Bacteroidota bacterium]
MATKHKNSFIFSINVTSEQWIEKMNWNESKATDCWCEGFNDSKNGKENKCPEKK